MKMTVNKFEIFKTAAVISVGLILTFASLSVLNLIYYHQSSTYIDEIFHIPQAKLYCKNQWTEWDPKITTLPGLYIVSYFFLKITEVLFAIEDFCSVYALRLTNLIGTSLNFFLSFKIICVLEEKHKNTSNFIYKLLTAFNVAVFPPLYFFTFLYYTDVWSTTFVLLMYYFHLLDGRMAQILGAFSGFMAVMMRQTNIIWVGLMLLDDVWNILCKNYKKVAVQDYKYSKKVCQKCLSDLFNFKNSSRTLKLFSDILAKTYFNIILCLLFITFVFINKSIVLGDKDAHIATFHPMQNLYFLDFIGFFGWPFFIYEVVSFWKKPPNIFLTIFLMGLCAALSEMNKLEHPYLLADNRHLAFYIWRRTFGHSIFRRIIIPTYVFFAILLFRLLQKRCYFMFMVMLSVCTFLNLTPQYLFELRYFIVPFLLYRLQFKLNSAVFFESLFFVSINAAVIYLFLNRPFVWPSEPNVTQRFIW